MMKTIASAACVMDPEDLSGKLLGHSRRRTKEVTGIAELAFVDVSWSVGMKTTDGKLDYPHVRTLRPI